MSVPQLPEPFSLYPLTPFDYLFESSNFVTGWLVEGDIDRAELEAALQRLTEKWRMLAGRIQLAVNDKVFFWCIRIPLGPLPPDYRTFALTSSTSQVPLSTYVKVPIPSVSTSLPLSFFMDPSSPRGYHAFEASSHPITSWHLTYFPASSNGGTSYTAIGFMRSHGVFDGTGASKVTKALVSEMKGETWIPPALPSEGTVSNPIAHELSQHLSRNPSLGDTTEYKGYAPLGVVGLLKTVLWHLKETYWAGADRRIVLLPKAALTYIVAEVRRSLVDEGKEGHGVTSGDVIVAWIYKTIYSSGTSPTTVTHCTNLASIRGILGNESSASEMFPGYVHNAFVPLPYPTFSVSQVQETPLHALAEAFASYRLALSKDQVALAYDLIKTLRRQNPFTIHPDANDDLLISNVSSSRILETDWSLIGAKRTLCGYRYQVSVANMLFTNAVYIAGRLADESVVLDTSLNSARMELFLNEVNRVTLAAGKGEQ
ncbi:hypothetical protein FA15DRAFT_594441 [Coprinopsis marcescibilis]|uniref:Uncharacterized protein n=1 Tax=Coprinopsis marcescibilis TaxID=230819 RepID=A0A5C3KSZ1_COPMA|nr:hypothetical protein FA15DRAFT_594441 [Coprinopsis marcescibilis]